MSAPRLLIARMQRGDPFVNCHPSRSVCQGDRRSGHADVAVGQLDQCDAVDGVTVDIHDPVRSRVRPCQPAILRVVFPVAGHVKDSAVIQFDESGFVAPDGLVFCQH